VFRSNHNGPASSNSQGTRALFFALRQRLDFRWNQRNGLAFGFDVQLKLHLEPAVPENGTKSYRVVVTPSTSIFAPARLSATSI